MLEEPISTIIIYRDMDNNFYRPIPPTSMSEEVAKCWFPYLSRAIPGTYHALILYRNPRVIAPQRPMMQNDSQGQNPLAPSSSGPQALTPKP